MKKKVLKEPTLVLMAGLPGVGKTTLARRLGEMSGWVVLEKDNLKDSLLEDTALKEKVDEETAGWAAYDNFFKMAEDFLLNQRMSVILDSSALHPFILERAKKLATCSGARFKSILCYVDEPIRQHRLRNRKERISQSHAGRIKEEAAKQFNNLPADTLKIYTKEPLEEYAEKALDYMQKKVKPQYTSVTSCNSRKHVSSLCNHFRHLCAGIIREYSVQGV